MKAKKLTLTAVLFLGASLAMTTAGLAQGYLGGPYGQGYYDYAPGPGVAPYYGYGYGYGPSANNCDRGGPGPRSGCGSGMGIGSQR